MGDGDLTTRALGSVNYPFNELKKSRQSRRKGRKRDQIAISDSYGVGRGWVRATSRDRDQPRSTTGRSTTKGADWDRVITVQYSMEAKEGDYLQVE
jgi:hypothetical protein